MESRRSGRSSRRAAKGSSEKVPSAIHYLGYVEEDETPEMIMKKFEQLDRIQQKNQSGCAPLATDEHMTEEDMLEVFKQTSLFNVKSAVHNNAILRQNMHSRWHSEVTGEDVDSECDWDEYRQYLSDEDGLADQQAHGIDKGRLRDGCNQASALYFGEPKRERPSKPRAMLAQYGQHFQAFFHSERVPESGTRALRHFRLPPPPVPPSWGRTIQPFEPAPAAMPVHPDVLKARARGNCAASGDDGTCAGATLLSFPLFQDVDWDAVAYRAPLQAVLVNSGWQTYLESGESAGMLSAQRLQAVPFHRLSPHGFVFVWAQKREIGAIFEVLCGCGYSYVENLTWVMIHVDKSILALPDHYSRRSHMTLLIFRKQSSEGHKIELKHQRNADVVFDCVKSVPGREWGVPDEAYHAIETLLPDSVDSRVELWSSTSSNRPGWLHVAVG